MSTRSGWTLQAVLFVVALALSCVMCTVVIVDTVRRVTQDNQVSINVDSSICDGYVQP